MARYRKSKGKRSRGKRTSWNRFFAKWRRKGLSPKAIGRKWRSASESRHEGGRRTGPRTKRRKKFSSLRTLKSYCATARKLLLKGRGKKARRGTRGKRRGKTKYFGYGEHTPLGGAEERSARWNHYGSHFAHQNDPGRRGRRGKKRGGKRKSSRRKSTWNLFFAKWRRKGLSPRAIGKKWKKLHGKKRKKSTTKRYRPRTAARYGKRTAKRGRRRGGKRRARR